MNRTSGKKSFTDYFRILTGGTIAFSLVNFSEKLISLILLPVFTFYLSPKDYGIISMVQTSSAFLVLFYNPGMMTATMRKYYDTEDENIRKQTVGSALLFFLMVSLVLSAPILVFGHQIFGVVFKDFQFYPYGVIAIALAAMTMPLRLWSNVWISHFRISIITSCSLLKFLTSVVISFVLIVAFHWGALGRLTGIATAQFALFVYAMFHMLRYSEKKETLARSRELFLFGYPLFFGVWSYTILNIGDRYILEKMIGLEAVGIYDVGYRFGFLPMMVTMAFKRMWNPVFYENMNDGNTNTLGRLITYYTLVMSTVCATIILFSPEAITLLINARFHSAIGTIPWLTCGVFFLGLQVIPGALLVYENRLGMVSWISGGCALFNVIANIVLIPFIGIMGAALATMISYFLYITVSCFIVRHKLMNMLEIRRLILPILFLICSLFVVTTIPYWSFGKTADFVNKLIIISLWIIGLLGFGYFTPSETNRLRMYVRKIIAPFQRCV